MTRNKAEIIRNKIRLKDCSLKTDAAKRGRKLLVDNHLILKRQPEREREVERDNLNTPPQRLYT